MFLASSLLYALLATATTGSEHLRQLKSTKAGTKSSKHVGRSPLTRSSKAGKSAKSWSKVGKSVKSWSKAGKKTKGCERPPKAKLPEQCENEAKVPTPALPVVNVVSQENFLKCVSALAASEFSFTDFSNYDKWFNDDSVLSLAPTGSYQGPINIAEYANFVNAVDVFSTYELALESEIILPIVADGDDCMVTSAVVNSMVTNVTVTPTTGAVSLDTVVGYRIQFAVLGESTILIDRIELYYPSKTMEKYFGEVLHTREMAERNCKILMNSCTSTFLDYNCFDENELTACIDEMLAMPGAEANGAIDGKSMSCRTLHGAFAATNSNHCPHMSFAPRYDNECNRKCQETKNRSYDELFLPEELAYFADFSRTAGLGDDQFASPSIFGY